jgi:hypothetical protein
MKHHRNKFFVVFSLVMVVVFTWWIWPAKQGTEEAVNSGTKALSVP